jgi:hypothetical protein
MQYRELIELTWEEARLEFAKINPELTTIIDRISPSKHYKLVKASYAFGDLIINKGTVYLPDEKKSLSPLSDLTTHSNIKSKLTYSTIPLFLTLKKANEVFIDTGSRIIPLNLFNPGSLLGLFESVDYMFNQRATPNWCVSAGARSIFMLPKISENSGLKRLRMHYTLPSSAKLQHISDHWEVFSLIANHENFKQDWQNEIIFFTEDWLLSHKNDPDWVEFHHYLFKHAWQQAQFAIGKIELSLYWESFVDAITSRNLKPTPYLADQVKHIMAIAMSRWPAFRPADDSQLVAPIKGLQQAFMEVYLLKNYLPTIMHTEILSNNSIPIYYSLYYPTLLEGSPNNKSASTIMLDLRDIKLLLDTYSCSIFNRGTNLLLKNNDFEYFHVEPDIYQEIKSSKIIFTQDEGFLQGKDKYSSHIFCGTSSFWRGCIRISAGESKKSS